MRHTVWKMAKGAVVEELTADILRTEISNWNKRFEAQHNRGSLRNDYYYTKKMGSSTS